MFSESRFVRQLDGEGNLGPIRESCVDRAQRTYFARAAIDTNPVIVQMNLRGKELIDHWYYRSKEWIDQPYFVEGAFLTPYVGPTQRADKVLYGDGKYVVDQFLTDYAKHLLEEVIETNQEAASSFGTGSTELLADWFRRK